MRSLPVLFTTLLSATGYAIDDYIDLSGLTNNAFIDPDTSTTGDLVANYKNSSRQNPEELGAYFEGDIRIQSNAIARNALVTQSSRWPNREVPYRIDGSFSADELKTIQWALDEFAKKTCIRFKKRSNEKDYVSIVSGNSGCWAGVGRIGGKQQVNLQRPGCLWKRGVVLHELMHAVGILHEQSRHDRDDYVTIHKENVESGKMHNFEKAPRSVANGLGLGYDYASLMHYSANAFSKNGKRTIEAKKNTSAAKDMGQRTGFSATDVKKIKLMYKC